MKEVKICMGHEEFTFDLDDAEITVTVDPATWMRRQEHTKEMTRLQAFADRQSERLQAALEINESYAEKIQSLRKELSAAKNVVQQLEDKNERLVLDAYTAKSEAQGRKEECLRFQKKLKETEELLSDKIATLQDARMIATDLGQKLAEARHEIRCLNDLDADRIAKIDELANCLQAERHEVERLKALLEARQDSTLKYENANLKELCNLRITEVSRLSRELSEKNTKLLQLKERLARIAENI